MKHIPWVTLSIHATDLRAGEASVKAAFEEVRALNANGIRTDLCWSDIEPRMGRWDEERLRWYQGYFERARQLNLAVVCVLYSLPNWIRVLSLVDPNRFLERWQIYCQKVEEILGESAEVIQVWNEVNHPYYQWVPARIVPSLFKIARGTLGARRKLAVNVYDGLPWQTYLDRLLAQAGDCIDIIGIDSFPETYKLNNARSWEPLEILLRRVNDPTDPWYGKKPALLETGFSTYIPGLKTPARQAEWIRSSFEAIRQLNDGFSNSIQILNWYKLFNDYGETPLNIIGHFGVLRMMKQAGRISKKQPAYATLAEGFGRLRD